jgi:hypothetical protein
MARFPHEPVVCGDRDPEDRSAPQLTIDASASWTAAIVPQASTPSRQEVAPQSRSRSAAGPEEGRSSLRDPVRPVALHVMTDRDLTGFDGSRGYGRVTGTPSGASTYQSPPESFSPCPVAWPGSVSPCHK